MVIDMEYPRFKIAIDSKKWQLSQQEIYEESLLLFVTSTCNLKCENCFSQYMHKDQNMSMEQIKRIVEVNSRFNKIDLMGGEPLMHPNINEIINTLHNMGKKVSLYTNGLLLNRLQSSTMPLRACISFYEVESNELNRKPISKIKVLIDNFMGEAGNKLKLILLIDKYNYERVLPIINYIDTTFSSIDTLTIGLMRYENDYWNDGYDGVLSFSEYAKTISFLLKEYCGRLNLDIFTKGVLDFSESTNGKNRTNRFKCVFPDNSYSECLFKACELKKPFLSASLLIPLAKNVCCITGRNTCLADKIRLKRI